MGLLAWLLGGQRDRPEIEGPESEREESEAPTNVVTAQISPEKTDITVVSEASEDYEIYDLFVSGQGARLPVSRRVWNEFVDAKEASASTLVASKSLASSPAATAATAPQQPQHPFAGDAAAGGGVGGVGVSGGRAEAAAEEEDDECPWVVLSTPTPLQMAFTAVPGAAGQPPSSGARAHAEPAAPVARGIPGAGKAAGRGGKAPLPPPLIGGAKAKGKGTVAARSTISSGKAPAPPFGKKLHWKLLPAASLEDTIFEELRPWGGGSGCSPLDTQQLERLFAPPAPRERASSVNADSSGVASARRNPDSFSAGGAASSSRGARKGQVCLLDPKRAQNLAIVLRQVTLPTEELAEVLRWMRLSHPIPGEMLEHIYENLLPHLLESDALRSYDGPPEELRNVEKQLLPLVRVPRLKARVRTMLFSKSMPVVHSGILGRCRALKDSCVQVRSSEALRKILTTVLRVGNYLNHGIDDPGLAGGFEVRGFAVESLLKLKEFRASTSGEAAASALHCVVLHLLQSDAPLLGRLKEQLPCCLASDAGGVGTVVSACIGDLRDAVCRFQSEIDLVQCEIERFGDSYGVTGQQTAEAAGGPLVVLQRLTEDAREMAKGLEASLTESLTLGCRLLEYFGEPPLDNRKSGEVEAFLAVEKFFRIINDFVTSFEECWKEVLEQPRKLKLEVLNYNEAPCNGGHGFVSGRTSTDGCKQHQQQQQQPPMRSTAATRAARAVRASRAIGPSSSCGEQQPSTISIESTLASAESRSVSPPSSSDKRCSNQFLPRRVAPFLGRAGTADSVADSVADNATTSASATEEEAFAHTDADASEQTLPSTASSESVQRPHDSDTNGGSEAAKTLALLRRNASSIAAEALVARQFRNLRSRRVIGGAGAPTAAGFYECE